VGTVAQNAFYRATTLIAWYAFWGTLQNTLETKKNYDERRRRKRKRIWGIKLTFVEKLINATLQQVDTIEVLI